MPRYAPFIAALAAALALPAGAGAATGYQSAVLGSTPAPDLYWPLDEAAGATSVADLSAGAHAGAVSGAALGAPGAFSLAQTSASFVPTQSISGDPGAVEHVVEAWVRPRVSNVQQTIVRQGNAATDGWELGISTKRKLIFTSHGSTLNSRISMPAGQWTMLTVSWSGSSVRFLTNAGASQDKTRNLPGGAPSPSSTAVTVGSGVLGGFDGRVDELALFPTLPADLKAFAQSHYNATSLPRNSVLPVISGTPTDGQKLTVAAGTWTMATSVAHQWMRCDATDLCDDIPGATGLTYDLGPADVGSTMMVEETATNTAGTAFVQSVETGVVAPLAPSATGAPVLTGTAAQGHALGVTDGTWSGTSPTFTYRWQRCAADGTGCADVGGATAATYLLGPADAGSALRAVVTASNGAGNASAPSDVSPVIAVVVVAPSNAAAPVLSGTAAEGQTLAVTPGTWDGTPIFDMTYQWQRCDADGGSCADLPGETGATHLLTAPDAGHRLQARATATNSAGNASATSGQSDGVTSAPSGGTGDPGTGGGTGGGAGDPGTGTGGDAGDPGAVDGGDATTTTDDAGTAGTGGDSALGAGTATVPAGTPATGCKVTLAPTPKTRVAKVRGAGRVTLRARSAAAGKLLLSVTANKRSVGRLVIRLDGRTLKGSKRAMTRTVGVSTLKAGKHVVSASVKPRRGKAKTLKLVVAVKGC